ncbi:MAG TPA: alpha-L-fucosidase [Pedobacter sp.]|jgi:alpha-L-fucosidase
MKIFLLTIALITGIYRAFSQETPSKEYLGKYNQISKDTEWWRDARFGMFIHFGPYAVPARGEWVKSIERLTTEQYQKYVDDFNPSEYDPKEWARIARQAGMKYMVMTAKHHDGYTLFNSKYTDYKISNKLKGRDLIKEFADACRAEGLKVGFYYSLIDWHHKDYPNVGNHPMRDSAAFGKKNYDWNNYLKYMHNQVEELMTRYGKIDILWLDYSFNEYSGQKWKAEELVKMVRKNQPGIILNNRLVVNEGVSSKERIFSGYGDFETPEMGVPEKALKDKYGKDIPWETCLTLNNSWGYSAHDQNWKSPELIVQTLVECVSKNGNLLLNVGPDAKGKIPQASVDVLSEVGKWMSRNSESIYGSGSSEIQKPDWGYYTKKGNLLYAHWMYPKIGHINIKGYGSKIKGVTKLFDGTEAGTANSWWGNEDPGNFFINVASPTYLTYSLPDPFDTVFRIELKK